MARGWIWVIGPHSVQHHAVAVAFRQPAPPLKPRRHRQQPAQPYAEVVRDAGLLRRVEAAGVSAVTAARSGEGDAADIAERAVEEMRAARDRGLAATDAPLLDLGTFLAETPEDPDWVIPGVLSRWDRLMGVV